ncbi:hypothetical protein HN840_04310 [archaeon]|jgi:hypothetical protein|nr:hypothetical protein [archaeon]MBT5288246.1 hypothetical protein [archaeon]MBT7281524.1 hypothetical protein [archaeon]
MKKGIVLLVFFLLSIGIVSAYGGIGIEEISSTTMIEPGQIAEYTLTIDNLGSKYYQLQVSGDQYAGLPSSYFEYVFVDPNYVELNGQESVQVNVTMLLKDDVTVKKRYETFITVTGINEESISEKYYMQIFAKEPTEPISLYIAEAAESVAPNNDFVLKLGLLNNMNEDLNNIDVLVSSELFEDQQTVQLFDEQEREVEFTFPIDSSTSPGNYTYSVRIYYDDELKATTTGEIVVEESLDVSETVKISEDFLYKEIVITIENTGNLEVSSSYEYPMPWYERWFASYSVDANVEDGAAQWTFNIAPEEDVVVVIDVDYRPLIIGIIALILAGIIAYFMFTRRVTINKKVFKMKYSTEGLTEFKVKLNVRNRTSKKIKDITVVDRLPRIIKPNMQFGTLHPSGVERAAKGVRMMWKINELVPGEERIISYDVQPRMGVIGRLTLPAAMGKFKNIRNRVTKIRSNSPFVYSGVPDDRKKKKR